MYFKRFPLVGYNFGDNEAQTLFPNLTAYVDIIDQVKQEISFYEKYTILDGDRPDIVSQKLYGTPDYHWTFFAMNDQLRESGWPMPEHELRTMVKKRYPHRAVTTEGNIASFFLPGVNVVGKTSGTTGKPKGVPRTHLAERSAALAHVAQNMYKNGEITLGVMPLYHTMGIRSLISMSLINGTFITQPKFSSLEAIKLINKFKITSLYLVPTLFHELIEDKSFTNNKVKSCKKLGFAGAPMNNGLIKKVMKAFKPIQLVNHYGSSEVYTFTVDQNADKKPGSAGKAGINQRIRVVEIGSKNPQKIVKKNIEGEIIASLKSEESFSGYLKRPDANKKSIIKNWYFTNDIGYIDNNGDLFVTGRVDDMIITGGENVSPIEIENLLSLNKNVLEVVVVGLPDEKWGQRICGFIKRDGNIEFGNLDKHCKESGMANFKRPKEYIFVKEIPKSPTGKILRRKLLAGEYDLDR